MPTSDQERKIARIAQMDWDEFEDRIGTAATRGASTTDEDALRAYFGAEEYEELKALAAQKRAVRAVANSLGNVVLLPGIMGSNLAAVDNGDQDVIWINLFRIARGQLDKLRLGPDGGDGGRVLPVTVDKRTYARALMKLSVRWDVEPFPFDWRRHLDIAADGLAKLIKDRFPNKPVHLVAHSMGGLVSRNFIHRHKDLWEEMKGDGTGARGGRLIMMGTPNYGSFAIPQALTGVEKMVRLLEKVDLSHNMKEVLEILDTFVGSYLMLPAPGKIPPETREIYRKEVWGRFPISAQHLDAALAFHKGLEDEATIDKDRMRYIAGCNQETLLGLMVIEPGEFRYVTTNEGDGRVPFTLGLLPGVPVYYVEEGHGSLPKNDRVIAAVDQLLERGSTLALPTRPPASRSILVQEGQDWHRSIGDYLVGAELEKTAKRAAQDEADADEIRIAEETLARAFQGESRPPRRASAAAGVEPTRATKKKPLAVEVVLGDVKQVAAPVVVVGSYKGVAPVNAIGEIDKALNYWISRAIEHSMLGADLGEVFFIPVLNKKIAASSVLVAGMGEEGRFNRHDLRYLMLNVTYAISALGEESFATILIGSGAGNLGLVDALRGLLFGVCDGLSRLGQESRLGRLTIVEYNAERHESIVSALETIQSEDSAAGFDIQISKRALPKKTRSQWARQLPPRPVDLSATFGPRITIERDETGDIFRFSALTSKAVVPVREVSIQSFFAEGIADRLMKSVTREEQEMLGRLLYSYLVPEDFESYFSPGDPVTLILDRSTAAFPWEMACFGTPQGVAFFGPELRLARQFKTLLSSRPAVAPRPTGPFRVLVVADPAPEAELQLPGARAEGEEVVRLLNQIKIEQGLRIDVISRIGAAECDPIEILALIMNQELDVIHFAGHGIYDTDHPDLGGWVFGRDSATGRIRTLSPREIFRVRRVPQLVFSNACFSSVVAQGRPLAADEMNRSLAGLAQAFFDRGVPNYLGAGWPIADDLAVKLAAEFYARCLTGRPAREFPLRTLGQEADGAAGRAARLTPMTVGESLAEARNLILNQGSTWGAYQHYGQPNACIFVPEQPEERWQAPRPAKKATAPATERPRAQAARAKPKPKTAGRGGRKTR